MELRVERGKVIFARFLRFFPKMKRIDLSLYIVLVTTLAFADVVAQQPGPTPPQRRRTAAAEPSPAVDPTRISVVYPTPLPLETKKPGFLKRIFGKKPAPTPLAVAPMVTPTPLATPTPRRKKRRVIQSEEQGQPVESDSSDHQKQRPSQTVDEVAKADIPKATLPVATPETQIAAIAPNASSTPLPDSLPPLEEVAVGRPAEPAKIEPVREARPTPKPIPEKVKASPLNQPIALVEDGSSKDDAVTLSPVSDAPAFTAEFVEERALERIRFQKLKIQALENAKVRDLKAKADSAVSSEERYQALKAYYPALFAEMRRIDSAFGKGLDRMEAAAKRRLERISSESVGNKVENSDTTSAPASGNDSDKKKSGG